MVGGGGEMVGGRGQMAGRWRGDRTGVATGGERRAADCALQCSSSSADGNVTALQYNCSCSASLRAVLELRLHANEPDLCVCR